MGRHTERSAEENRFAPLPAPRPENVRAPPYHLRTFPSPTEGRRRPRGRSRSMRSLDPEHDPGGDGDGQSDARRVGPGVPMEASMRIVTLRLQPADVLAACVEAG